MLLIQTTRSCSLRLAVSENVHRSCRPHGRVAVAYTAAESILPLVLHVTKCCRRNGLLLAQLAVDIGRRAAGRRNTSICRLLIQTTQTCSVPLQYLERSTAAVDLMVERQKPYIAGESITSSRFTCDEVLPSKWSIACAITISAVDIGRRAAGQVNTSICRLLIQTIQTGSLPLQYPMITAAVDLMIEQQ